MKNTIDISTFLVLDKNILKVITDNYYYFFKTAIIWMR